MPRDGSGIYSTPPGTHGTPNTTILSANYNSNVDDVATDLNTPRPIVAGGTGATTAAGALTALGAAPLASPVFTGDPQAPTPPAGDNDTSIATTAFVQGANLGGLLNKFRNGTMDMAQHSTVGSVTAGAPAYVVDGWLIGPLGAAAAWSQQYGANIAGGALRIAGAAGLTSVTLTQRLEGVIASQLLAANKTATSVTIQFTIFNNSGAAITPLLRTDYPGLTQDVFVPMTADVSPVSLPTVPNASLATVAYSFTPSALIWRGYSVGLIFGALTSGYVDVSLADIRATPGVPLGINASPPAPERRPMAFELAFCQRYFQALPNMRWDLYGAGGSLVGTSMLLPVPMRATPTVSNPDNTGSSNATGQNYQPLGTSGLQVYYTVAATGIGTLAVAGLTLSAEL